MTLNLGNKAGNIFALGSKEISTMYLGSKLVYSKTTTQVDKNSKVLYAYFVQANSAGPVTIKITLDSPGDDKELRNFSAVVGAVIAYTALATDAINKQSNPQTGERTKTGTSRTNGSLPKKPTVRIVSSKRLANKKYEVDIEVSASGLPGSWMWQVQTTEEERRSRTVTRYRIEPRTRQVPKYRQERRTVVIPKTCKEQRTRTVTKTRPTYKIQYCTTCHNRRTGTNSTSCSDSGYPGCGGGRSGIGNFRRRVQTGTETYEVEETYTVDVDCSETKIVLVNVTYTETELYYVNVPYQVTLTDTQQVPLTKTIAADAWGEHDLRAVEVPVTLTYEEVDA